jgi:glycerol-3-phosphate acyltransferase PlsX
MTASRIGIDILGGDLPPKELLAPLLQNLPQEAHYRLYLTEDLLPTAAPSHIRCVTVQEVITMQDDPLVAARGKPRSSLTIGLSDLAEGKIDAFITHGNTGALTALSSRLLPHVLRPALLAATTKGVVVDAGAAVTASAEQLGQFALFGILYQKIHGISHPKVGLLNIGKEAGKGRAEHKAFYDKMQSNPYFIGNIEPKDIFEGKVDVIVTDGFSGNLLLKAVEASFHFLEKPLPFHHFPGALLAGVSSIVIKCHGNSHAEHFCLAAKEAILLLEKEFLGNISKICYTSGEVI